MVDQIGELGAVGGRAARIDREHGIAGRRVELVVGREMRAVGGERAAMDFEDQRVALPLDIVGRQGQPGVDRPLVDRGGDRRSGAPRRAVLSSSSSALSRVSCRRAPPRTSTTSGGRVALPPRQRDRAVARDAEAAAGIGPVEIGAGQPFGDGADRAVEADPRDLGLATIVIVRRRSSARPPAQTGSLDAAVERGGQRAPVRAVGVHHVEDGILIAALAVVEAGIGDQPAVGRHRRLVVRPVAVVSARDPVGGDVERVDFGVEALALPIRASGCR